MPAKKKTPRGPSRRPVKNVAKKTKAKVLTPTQRARRERANDLIRRGEDARRRAQQLKETLARTDADRKKARVRRIKNMETPKKRKKK